MRQWKDLDDKEKQQARDIAVNRLMKLIIEYDMKLGYGADEAIRGAAILADAAHTPWFVGEFIWEARFKPPEDWDTDEDGFISVGDLLTMLGHADAEDALYPSPGELIIRLEGGYL